MTDTVKVLDESLATKLTPNQLSTLRTIMAADRTLMAWVRTALSLQSFGFTIYKVLQGFIADGQAIAPGLPVRVGLVLSFASVMAMLMGILEYRHTLATIGAGHAFKLRRLTILLAAILLITGIALFVAIATHAV